MASYSFRTRTLWGLILKLKKKIETPAIFDTKDVITKTFATVRHANDYLEH